MPNNAGVVDATPTRRIMHLSYIDSEGKPRTDSYDVPVSTTDAQMNTLTAAQGAVTNASLWQIGYTNWFATGPAQKSDADDVTNDSVADNIVFMLKNAANDSIDFYIPANLETTTMVLGTENPDPNTIEMGDVITALQAIFTGYTVVSVRFTERAQKNRAIKL